MKKFLYLCLIFVGVGLFVSCKSKNVAVASFSDLDGEWNIVELNGKVLNPTDSRQFIAFDVPRQTLSGNAGCNRMMGKIEYDNARKNIIKFAQVATTRMACPDMSGERELLQAIEKTVRFAQEGNVTPVTKIAFYGTDNSKLMVIEKKK